MLKVVDIFLFSMVFLISLSLYYSNSTKWTIKNKLLFFIVVISLIIIYTFRDLGLDIEVYRELFKSASLLEGFAEIKVNRTLEFGWIFLIFILKKFDLSFNVFLFFSALVPFLIIFYTIFIEKIEKEAWLVIISFLILFLFSSLDAIRAFFAASLVMLAVYNYSLGNIFRYLIFSLIAILFHNSAVIALIIPLLIIINWKLSWWFFAFLLLSLTSIILRTYVANINFLELGLEQSTSIVEAIYWRLLYYLLYYNAEGYSFINFTHQFLTQLIMYSNFISYTLLSFILFSIKTQSVFIENSKKVFLSIFLIYSSLFIIGSEILAFRLILISNLALIFIIPYILKAKLDYVPSMLRLLMLFSVFINNFVVLLYQAGLHQPMSPFFIGV